MRRAREPNQREARDGRSIGDRDGQRAANFDACGTNRLYDRARRKRTGARVEIRWIVDLGVKVIGRACAAETTTSVHYSSIWKKHTSGMIVSRDRYWGHLSELLSGGIPKLRDQLRGLIREAHSIVLAAGDEDLTIRKDYAVVEGARISHGIDVDNGGFGRWGADSDDMSVRSAVGVYRR